MKTLLPVFKQWINEENWASQVELVVKNLPSIQETWVRSLGQEDPLEEGMAAHSNTLCLENSMDRGAWWVAVRRVTQSQTRLKQLSTT